MRRRRRTGTPIGTQPVRRLDNRRLPLSAVWVRITSQSLAVGTSELGGDRVGKLDESFTSNLQEEEEQDF